MKKGLEQIFLYRSKDYNLISFSSILDLFAEILYALNPVFSDFQLKEEIHITSRQQFLVNSKKHSAFAFLFYIDIGMMLTTLVYFSVTVNLFYLGMLCFLFTLIDNPSTSDTDKSNIA